MKKADAETGRVRDTTRPLFAWNTPDHERTCHGFAGILAAEHWSVDAAALMLKEPVSALGQSFTGPPRGWAASNRPELVAVTPPPGESPTGQCGLPDLGNHRRGHGGLGEY
jgi:hypothetical protein